MAQAAPLHTLHEIADGVFVWLQEGTRGAANAAVVVDDDGLTVVDTLMVRSQWVPFGEAVDALGRPVRRVVLTCAHIEQVGGTTRFRQAAVLASRATSALLEQPMPVEAYKAFMPAYADEFDDLAEVGTRPVSHLVTGAGAVTPRVEVLPAVGHSPGDVMVLVADADVLVTGDLCTFGVRPLGFQADPAAWADVLDVVVDLGATIVPGHGAVGGEDDVRALQGYLRACVAAEGDVAAVAHGPWAGWLEPALDEVNVERAALLARGEDRVPPSMLRAMGRG